MVHQCPDCGYENHNLERDEEGDLVCEQCGAIISEETALATVQDEKDEEYECPDCGHVTINPEPDDEGDRICEECGCILPEKLRCECKKCGHLNVDPEPNEEDEYLCEACGEPLDVEVGAKLFVCSMTSSLEWI